MPALPRVREHSASPVPSIGRDVSMQIEVCRVLCIFFMMYVHVSPGLDAFEAQLGGVLGGLKTVLIDNLGRASVPALSVVSGFLVVPALLRSGWLALVRERFGTLIVPMVFWNVAILALSLAIFHAIGARTTVMRALTDTTPLGVAASRVLSLDYGGATTALNFLRDVFVCVLLSPLLLSGVRRAGWLFVAALWAAGLAVGFAPLVYRPGILMFFTVGMIAAQRHGRLALPTAVTAAVVAAGVAIEFARWRGWWVPSGGLARSADETVRRVVFSVLILAVSLPLGRTAAGAVLARFEPPIYLVFLGHSVAFMLAWGAWQKVFGTDLDFPYVVFFLLAPPAWMLLARLLWGPATRLPPGLQRLFKGKASRPGAGRRGSRPLPAA